MDIYEEIRRGQEQEQDLFKKALSPTLNEMVEDIKKAKALPDGTIKEWGGVKYKKVAGKWAPVGKDKNTSQEGESDSKPQVTPEVLAEHAKNASEQALMNATKTSPDPAVRSAAHKEMMRRKNEEAGETFKAPEGEKVQYKGEEHTKVKESDKIAEGVAGEEDKEKVLLYGRLSGEKTSRQISQLPKKSEEQQVADTIESFIMGQSAFEEKSVKELKKIVKEHQKEWKSVKDKYKGDVQKYLDEVEKSGDFIQ